LNNRTDRVFLLTIFGDATAIDPQRQAPFDSELATVGGRRLQDGCMVFPASMGIYSSQMARCVRFGAKCAIKERLMPASPSSFASVKLPAGLVTQAREAATPMRRSVAGQIEYWATLGRIAEA
jgi:ParD-like antitoxin of type II bacterial toxin-antitoxin system